jgi:tRNA(fMet)-specific endonuclease VapC
MKAQLEKEGRRLDDMDLMIASTALASNLILVTNNAAHFERITGLKVNNSILSKVAGLKCRQEA